MLRDLARKLGRNDSGSVLTYMVVLPVLAGSVALGVETGEFYRIKRQMQSAADAAAVTGSYDRVNGANAATITTDGRYEAQRNGFTNGVNGVSVTINSPPSSGSYTGSSSAVEAIITKSQSYSLGAVLYSWMGHSNTPFTMRARSVAAQGSYSSSSTGTTTTTTSDGCLVALTPDNEQGVSLSNFNNFSSDCSVESNGRASTADANASIYVGGKNDGTAHAQFKTIYSRGSFYYFGLTVSLTGSTLVNQTTSVVDPYASLPTPSPGSCDYTNFSAPKGSSVTLSPGTYCGGLTANGTVNNVYFTHGTYYIANGDLYITGVNGVSCTDCTDGVNGVTIILTQTTGNNSDIGGFFISSDNNVTLSAPPSGTYKGVLAYQDRRAPTGTMSSSSKIFTISSLNNAKLSGAIYFPNNAINISNLNNSGNSTNGCTVWVGRYVKFSSYNNNYIANCSLFGTTPAGYQTTTTGTTTTSINLPKVME